MVAPRRRGARAARGGRARAGHSCGRYRLRRRGPGGGHRDPPAGPARDHARVRTSARADSSSTWPACCGCAASRSMRSAPRMPDAGRASRETFDLATSRAAAPPDVLIELALPLLRIGGSLCALVADASATLASCAAASAACGGGVPRGAGRRCASGREGLAHPRRAIRAGAAFRAGVRSADPADDRRGRDRHARSTGARPQRSRASSRVPCPRTGPCLPAAACAMA